MVERPSPTRLPPLSFQLSLATSTDPNSTIGTVADTTAATAAIDNYAPISPDVQTFQYGQSIAQDIAVSSQLRQTNIPHNNQYIPSQHHQQQHHQQHQQQQQQHQQQTTQLTSATFPKLPPLTNHLPLYNGQREEFDRQVEHMVSPLPQNTSPQEKQFDTYNQRTDQLSLSQQNINTYSTNNNAFAQSQALAQQQLQLHQHNQQFQQQFSQGMSSFQTHTLQEATKQQQDTIQYDANKMFQNTVYDQQRLTSPATMHETSSVMTNSDRIPSISLPLPNTKSNGFVDSQVTQYQGPVGTNISPVSIAQSSDPALCVSPISTSQQAIESINNSLNTRTTTSIAQVSTAPPISVTPTVSTAISADYQPITQVGSSRIDDSLIARLRDFNDGRPVTTIVRGRSPQIRDTTENLLAGYRESFLGGQGDGIQGGNNSTTLPDRPHVCRKCTATFRRRDNLMAHIRAQHKGERPFKCEVCGFRFIKKDHAMKHWKVVHLKERPFVCSECNNRFGQRSDLNKHVRSVHLRIKPFECEHCHLKFSHRGNQIRHQAVVHEKKKPYKCTECQQSFAEKSNLVKHRQALHKTEFLVGGQR